MANASCGGGIVCNWCSVVVVLMVDVSIAVDKTDDGLFGIGGGGDFW